MEPYDDSLVTVSVQVHGLREAVQRLEAAAADPENWRGMYLPLFETLNWAASLDDRVGVVWRPSGGDRKLGPSWRERVSGGEVVTAIDWARNIVHHQWADALRLDPAGHGLYPSPDLLPGRDLYPRPEYAWVWRDLTDLPRRRDRKRRKRAAVQQDVAEAGADAYRQHLQGQAAGETMRTLLATFELALEFLEPKQDRKTREGSAS